MILVRDLKIARYVETHYVTGRFLYTAYCPLSRTEKLTESLFNFKRTVHKNCWTTLLYWKFKIRVSTGVFPRRRLLLLLLLPLLGRPVGHRLVGHVALVLALLVHGEGVPRLGDLAADVADVAGRFHVVGLDVAQHGGAPGALLAAQVAGVDAVRVAEQPHHQLVQVRHGGGRAGHGGRGCNDHNNDAG